jgi:hypothetical protein
MSFKQYDLDKSSVFGFGNVARVYLPYLTGNLRRKNPDMSSTVPYFPSLTGSTLIIEQGGDFTGTTTITFTSDSYAQAITDITTAGAGNFVGIDSNGYLSIKSTYSGGQNYLKLTGGTAQVIVGMQAYPSPAGISYAGEIDTAKSNFYEKSVKGESVALQNDALNRENWNRGLAAVSYILDTVKANQDKELAVPKEFDVSISGTSFTISSDDRLYVNAANILVSQPNADQIDNVVSILDEYHNQIFDNNGDRVRVTSITYGPLVNQTQSFADWSVADGKQVFGALSHFQKLKATYTIQDVIGNMLRVSGGNLLTDKVQPNDTIVISGATNKNPFSHNGEFLVDKVLSSELLQIRPKGNTDFKLFAVETPSSINPIVGLGEVLGTLTAYVGKFMPLIMKADSMYFNLSASLPAGTYKVRLAIGRSIKDLLKEDLSSSDIISPFGGQLEFGSKLLSSLTAALKPRIISKPASITSKTLFAEFFNNTTLGAVGSRIYTNSLGGLDIVYNGKWDGVTYVKDDAGQDTVRITENGTELFLGDSTFSINLDHVNNNLVAGSSTNYLEVDHPTGNISANMTSTFDVKDGTYTVLSVPNFDGLISGQISARQGINLGTGFSSDAQHLVEKINYNCNTTAGKYTLLSETTLSGPKRREYVKDDGTRVDTFNAKWSGVAWVKDSLGTASLKNIKGSEGQFEFLDVSGISPFADTSWDDKNDFKFYQFNEEFCKRIPTVTSLDEDVGELFSVYSITNSSWYNTLLPAGYGEITCKANLAAPFSSVIRASVLNFGSANFNLIFKITCLDFSVLDTMTNGGLYVGGFGIGEDIVLRTGSDVTSWYTQYQGGIPIDTGISNGPTEITAAFRRIGDVLYTYINGILIDTRAWTVSHVEFLPTIGTQGTATAINQEILTVNTVKQWVSRTDY